MDVKQIILTLALSALAFAQSTAIQGYDTVSFFEGKAEKGVAQFSTEHDGKKWQFATADHLAQFKADPAKYAPQYDGVCAWAVGHGYVYKGDPEAWTIKDGKLYFNANKDVRAKWLPDAGKWIAEGDKHWPHLRK